MSPATSTKTETIAVIVSKTGTEVVTVSVTKTVTTLNRNNRPNRTSRSSHSGLNRPFNTNKSKRLFQYPERKLAGKPFKVKTGLPGRPKELPSGTVELLKQSQNKDIFIHPLTSVKIRFEDAQPPFFFKVDDQISNCKFQIPFLYKSAAYPNIYLGTLDLSQQLEVQSLPEAQTEAETDAEAGAEGEGELEAESYQDAQPRPELDILEYDTISDEDLLTCYLNSGCQDG